MRLLVVGGGPGGLYTALLTRLRHPGAEVLVVERNRPSDTFGWGVVLSDQTIDNMHAADPTSARALADALHHWDDIGIHIGGRTVRSSGHGFSGISRRRLLELLQERCRQLGVTLQFETDVDDIEALAREFRADIVIASDGINSRTRERWSHDYRPDVELRNCRFVWLGTTRRFDAFTFAFEQTRHGWVQAHAYQFDDSLSTFIVEMPEHTWQAHGLDAMDTNDALRWCEQVFAAHLDGHALQSNATHKRGSAQWIRFPRVTCESWVHWLDDATPVVLLGDAAHTAHFSIGSGTRLAIEDAIEIDRALAVPGRHLREALAEYQALRSVEVLKLQNAARNSTEWFEHVDRYTSLPIEQFAYSLLTRSQRISHENLRLRDPQYIAEFEQWFATQANQAAGVVLDSQRDTPARSTRTTTSAAPPPMFTPYKVRDLVLNNRVVVSPMAQYTATTDGMPTDWHFVHLGARASGGAALVMTEMTCVAPDARITPWCTGLWCDAHLSEWTRIVRYVHEFTSARIGLQLGHAGAKGATRKMWEGVDQPLTEGAWPLIAPSDTQYLSGVSQVARAMTRDDMERVRDEFVRATQFGELAGFDWLELHCAHGYLLSAFLSPLTNHRTDDYGGSVANRLRYPLEVFAAVRDAWPAHKPMSVRISAHDWFPGGNTADDAVAIAQAFRNAGADMIDVSSGQVVKEEQPVFGRMWQTPFADRIRQEVGIPTIAVGAVTDADQLNGILGAGRADLVAVGRPHLVNPAWTLSESVRLGYDGAEWPAQYLWGKSQLERLVARERAMQQQEMQHQRPRRPGELT